MLYPIQPGCYKPRADGKSNIHIQYCFTSAKKPLLDTQIIILVEYWDKEKREISPDLPLEYGLASKLNPALQQQIDLVGNVIKYAIRTGVQDRAEFVKKFYKPDLDIFTLDEEVKKAEQKRVEVDKKTIESERKDIFKQLELYIQAKEQNLCSQFPAMVRNIAQQLAAYQLARNKRLTFESFEIDFFQDFVNYLSYEHIQVRRKKVIVGLKINTVGKTMNLLRRFINHRIQKKIIPPIDLSEWESVGEDADAVYLTWDEIEKNIHSRSFCTSASHFLSQRFRVGLLDRTSF
jgi:hypothetical protein